MARLTPQPAKTKTKTKAKAETATGPKGAAPRPATRHDQKVETRRRLVEGAQALFAKQGIGGTSTAEIAKGLALSHGTIFLHFPTRDDLVMAVIDDFGARLAARLDASFGEDDAGSPPRRTIKAVLEGHLAALVDFEDFYYRLLTELPSLPPVVQSTVFLLNAAVSWRLHRAAEAEIDAGRVKRLSRAQLFNSWMALLTYHLIFRGQFADTKPYLAAKGKDLVKTYLQLISAKP